MAFVLLNKNRNNNERKTKWKRKGSKTIRRTKRSAWKFNYEGKCFMGLSNQHRFAWDFSRCRWGIKAVNEYGEWVSIYNTLSVSLFISLSLPFSFSFLFHCISIACSLSASLISWRICGGERGVCLISLKAPLNIFT